MFRNGLRLPRVLKTAQTVITCLSTMKKSMTEEDAISCLVLVTESSGVYILDPEAFTVLTTGKKLWTVRLSASVTTMEAMDHKSRGFKAVLVALNNCEVHVFRDKFLVNTIKTEDIVTGMKFGRFGREDGTLIMTTKGWDKFDFGIIFNKDISNPLPD